MDRRGLLGVVAGAAGLMTIGGSEVRAANDHDEHLKILGECFKVCNEAARHCLDSLKKGGPHAEQHAKSHEAAMDCQSFCALTAELMARSSSMAAYAHRACADACRDCATACESHQAEIMTQCVKVCRDCEKVCREMMNAAR